MTSQPDIDTRPTSRRRLHASPGPSTMPTPSARIGQSYPKPRPRAKPPATTASTASPSATPQPPPQAPATPPSAVAQPALAAPVVPPLAPQPAIAVPRQDAIPPITVAEQGGVRSAGAPTSPHGPPDMASLYVHEQSSKQPEQCTHHVYLIPALRLTDSSSGTRPWRLLVVTPFQRWCRIDARNYWTRSPVRLRLG